MKLNWLISTVVATLVLGVSPSFAASDSTKTCALLTRDELAGAGVAVTGLFPDDPTLITKDSAPEWSLPDIQMEGCRSEMGAHYLFPVSWSVGTTKDPIDKKAWKQMSDALDRDTKGNAAVADVSEQQLMTIEGIECGTYSWPFDGKRNYGVSCGTIKNNQAIHLVFEQIDKAKLPPPRPSSAFSTRCWPDCETCVEPVHSGSDYKKGRVL